MTEQAVFKISQRNPDVLTCIANLSNDEVFTPPDFANRMLDDLARVWALGNGGANLWSDRTVRFLDPFTKSGVFLREIAARLVSGLADEIPDLEERVDHILTKQVFGIAITSLTSLIARRSLYCSKWANGPHSIGKSFTTESGNVWFEPIEHTWVNGTCRFCGASQKAFDRGPDSETHAYAFIHTDHIRPRLAELFGDDMQFDVIIGNPPYQLNDGGYGASALPIYNKFVEQAKALQPRLLSMVIPSRWFFGGRGLDEFRRTMLADRRMRELVDYPDSRQCFQGVDVAGGICYFLWDRDHEGDCKVLSYSRPEAPSEVVRPLLEPGADFFVRSNESVSIVKRVMLVETGKESLSLPADKRFEGQVSSQKPFGLRTFFRGSETRKSQDDVVVLQSGGRAWTSRGEINVNVGLIDKWKVFTSKSSSEHAGQADKNGMRRVLSLSGVLPPGSVVTETYVLLGAYDDEETARNCMSYVLTKFFRFLVATRSSAQDLSRSAYSLVPMQDFSESWSDEKLYRKYGLTQEQIGFIEASIRPMEIDSNA